MVFNTEADFLDIFQINFLSPFAPFHTVSPSVFLVICLMAVFIFCTPTWAVVKNLDLCYFSCLLQQDNSLQFCLCFNSHSVIIPFNLCSAPDQTVPFSIAHFHPMTGVRLHHSWSTDQILGHWIVLLARNFIRPWCYVVHFTLLQGFWQPTTGVGHYICFVVLLSPLVTACFVPDFFKTNSVW